MTQFHIIGAGLAGLAAACKLADHVAGSSIHLYEATAQAGGRCRSFHDPQLNRTIDNGNHLLLGANQHALRFIQQIGAMDRFHASQSGFSFADLSNSSRRTIHPPHWHHALQWVDAPSLLRLFTAKPHHTVTDRITPTAPCYRTLIEPFCLAVLNTIPAEASATMLRHCLWQLIRAGKSGTTAYTPVQNWQHAIIDPALDYLQQRGVTIHYQQRIKTLSTDDNNITILAAPAHDAARLLPNLTTPTKYQPIINGHFAIDHGHPTGSFLGLLGGTAQWLFFKDGLISTPTSAASDTLHHSQEALATLLWADICTTLGWNKPLPPHRILIEKRATFTASPEQLTRRPQHITPHPNLLLAGDYTASALPATIEQAIASGRKAAQEGLKIIQ